VANLRVDQAWGSAQLMGAIHDVAATYYGAADNTGHPSDEIGWAVGAGIKLLAPMIGQGDYFQAQVNYTEGARKYVDFSYNNMYSLFNGGSYGIGIGSDGVYAGTNPTNGTSIELTTAWGVNAAYEHFWSKSWQTSVYGAYIATSYNATANALLCAGENAGGIWVANSFSGTCDNNWQVWNIGTRTQWNVDSQTAMGVDIVYQKLQTANGGASANVLQSSSTTSQPTAVRTFSDQGAFMGQFRIHRNFYP
jgi:hypothetical protein